MSGYENFINNHQDQLLACEIPKHYWRTLFEKLKFEIFDADESYRVVKNVEAPAGKSGLRSSRETFVSESEGIKIQNGEKIFLIDHAWTFSLVDARDQLSSVPGLLERVAGIAGVEQCAQAERVEAVMEEIWKHCRFCSIADPETGTPVPIWYLWDEFGSSLSHGPIISSNVRVRPFYYADRQASYSVLWPLVDLKYGDRVTLDLVGAIVDEDSRRARAVPWTGENMTSSVSDAYTELDDSHYSAGETLPPTVADEAPSLVSPTAGVGPLRVYTDFQLIRSFLTDEKYKLVDEKAEADVIWISEHIKDFRAFAADYPNRFYNQFPGEYVVTTKDMLALTCRRSQKDRGDSSQQQPPWLPVTYLLQEELAPFVSHYQKRRKSGRDNVWICKPWNQCRGQDIHITDNLNYLVRLAETGPKVVCKYVEDPVLYHMPGVGRVKFDVRYVIYLTSVRPLVLHVNKVFWLRFANKPFSLEDFHDYQKHFTVMNYVDGGEKLKQVHSHEFVREFNSQYADFPWEGVEASILSMLKDVFECATSEPFPRGIHHYQQARAIYAVDLMLSWTRDDSGTRTGIQPQICEVNYSPDNVRACQYHPNFYNQAFDLLFSGIDDGGFHKL